MEDNHLNDFLFIKFYFIKEGEHFLYTAISVSRDGLQQMPGAAISRMLLQIGNMKIFPDQQEFLEKYILAYAAVLKNSNRNTLHVLIIIEETLTEANGEEYLTGMSPRFYFDEPSQDDVDIAIAEVAEEGAEMYNYRNAEHWEAIRKFGYLVRYEVYQAPNREETCPYCRDDYEDGRSSVFFLPCSHSLCYFCFLVWYKNRDSCPKCRDKLVPASYIL